MKRSVGVLAAVVGAASLALSGCADAPPQPLATAESVDLGINPEFGSIMASCLVGLGWDAEETGDGGITSDIPEGQEDAYNADLASCQEENGFDKLAPKLTEPELRLVYLMELDTADCIRDEGFDPGNPPSEQSFVDAALVNGNVWDPYEAVYGASNAQVTEEEYFALLQTCPRPGY